MPRVTITVPEKTPQPYRFQLDRESVTLGRGSENDIAIDCGSVSVKHAEMLRVTGGYELRDVGSTNGIKLDGERREVIPLQNGLSVKLGDVAFDFSLGDEELAALALEKPAGQSPIEKVSDDDGPMQLPPLHDQEDAGGRPAPRMSPVPVEDESGGGLGMIVLFIILAAAAFFAGMAIHFQKETGGSLIDAIKAKSRTFSIPAHSAPAASPDARGPAK